VSIALTGQPSLDDVIDEVSLAPLRQRTRLRQRLRPMSQDDTLGYIRHRVRIAGGDADEMFTPEALLEIHRLTLGTPRLINTLCDSALMVCRVDEQPRVDLETITNVVKDLGWRWSEPSEQRSGDSDRAISVVPGQAREPGGRAADQDRSRAMLWLSEYSRGRLVASIPVETFPFTIGRQPGNSLVLPEMPVSRRHALINRIGDRYIIEDLHSINGIMVNGRSCDTAVLKLGDVVRIGTIELVVSSEEEPVESSALHHDDLADTGSMMETQSVPEENRAIALKGRRRRAVAGDQGRGRFEAD
jgi:hypothetical protein